MEHHHVQRVVQVLGHFHDIISCQSVDAVNGFILQVRPINVILCGDKEKSTLKHQYNYAVYI